MTEAQRKNVVLKAARNAALLIRQMDSQGEIVERWLRSQINRKSRITPDAAVKIDPLWRSFIQKTTNAEKAIADFIRASQI